MSVCKYAFLQSEEKTYFKKGKMGREKKKGQELAGCLSGFISALVRMCIAISGDLQGPKLRPQVPVPGS